MGKIVILDENTSNKIAAGEVIERPASVVKELVENSIDSGAGNISVEIRNGGISYIKVTDNGSGMDEDDVEIAFERHATSKIRHADDLEAISTLGFRGEALASIAAVATVELTTRTQKNPHGMYVKIQGGSVKEVRQTGCPIGTTFVVRDLFYNTPARFKFLKKDSTEAGYVSDIVSRVVLGNPKVSFRLVSNHSTLLHSPGNNDLLSAIFSIYGKETAKEVLEICYSDPKVKITGYAGKPEIARSNRNHQSIFINGRLIRSKIVTSAIDEAYRTYLMKNKFPFIVMNIDIQPLHIDVNVHPTKMEVRFSEEQEVFRSIFHAITNAFMGKSLVRTVVLEDRQDRDLFKFKDGGNLNIDYTQQALAPESSAVKESPREAVAAGKPDDPSGAGFHFSAFPPTPLPENREIPLEKSAPERNNFLIPENNKDRLELKAVQTREETAPAGARPPGSAAGNADSSGDSPVGRDRNILSQAQIIGQLFATYILLQYNDELLMIDQHAAHERLMYERLKEKYGRGETMAQVLISPVVVELTYQELKFIEGRRDFFNKLGYIFEDFGNNSIIVRAVPLMEDAAAIKETLLEVLDRWMNTVKTDPLQIPEEALYDIACKSAVKANKRLDAEEVRVLLKEMAEIDNPYTCPHGRPTVIRITKHELEKRFKRIL